MLDCTAIILTFNEESNIEQCILSILDFCSRIVLVDSFSTDSTVEIARRMGCDVYFHKFDNYSKQFNYGLKNTGIDTEWVLRIDADERLTPFAKKEIISKLSGNSVYSGVLIPFEVFFLGKRLKHGGIYPFKKLSLFKRQYAQMEEKNMDEHIVLSQGKICLSKVFLNITIIRI